MNIRKLEKEYGVHFCSELKSFLERTPLDCHYKKLSFEEIISYRPLKNYYFLRTVSPIAIARNHDCADPLCIMLKGSFEGWIIHVRHDGIAMLVSRSLSDFIKLCESKIGLHPIEFTEEEEHIVQNTFYEDEDDQIAFLLIAIQSVKNVELLNRLYDFGDSDIRLACLERLKSMATVIAESIVEARELEFQSFVEDVKDHAKKSYGIEVIKGGDFDVLFDERKKDNFNDFLKNVLL